MELLEKNLCCFTTVNAEKLYVKLKKRKAKQQTPQPVFERNLRNQKGRQKPGFDQSNKFEKDRGSVFKLIFGKPEKIEDIIYKRFYFCGIIIYYEL